MHNASFNHLTDAAHRLPCCCLQSAASPLQPSLGMLSPGQHMAASTAIDATTTAPFVPACGGSRADMSETPPAVAAPAPAASSDAIDYLNSGSSSPMAVATVGVAGSVAQVHLELNSMMFDILAGLPGCTTSGNANATISGHGTAADGEMPPALPAVLLRSVDANAAAELSSMLTTFDSRHGTVAQPVPKTRVLTNLAEWEALFEEQQLKRSSRRRRCCRGGSPWADDSSSSDEEDEQRFTACAVQEPACEGAVPAAVALLESQRSMTVEGVTQSGSSSNRHSTDDDCRDGSFIVPQQEEEEEEAELAGPGKQLQRKLAAGRGLGSWWRGRVSGSFRKAADSIFGPASGSSKELQVAGRADAAARASLDTVTTEGDEEAHEIEVAQATNGSGGGAGGGVLGAGSVGYLTKLFSIRSRRDVLLAAGDQ